MTLEEKIDALHTEACQMENNHRNLSSYELASARGRREVLDELLDWIDEHQDDSVD